MRPRTCSRSSRTSGVIASTANRVPPSDAAPRRYTVGGSRRPAAGRPAGRMVVMADSVYRVTELVGTSSESWEKAAAAAVETASQTLRHLRIAEVVELA